MKKIEVLLSKIKWPQALLIFSLLIIISLLSYYLLRIDPYIKLLQGELTSSEQVRTKAMEQLRKLGCNNTYSPSTGEYGVICQIEELKAPALSDCSLQFAKITAEGFAKYPNESMEIDKLDKFRNFFMKKCMENNGFEY